MSEGALTFNENYAFVMNVRSLVSASSYTVAPGHELRRANSAQIAEIRGILEKFSGIRIATFHFWEGQLPLTPGPIVYLDETEWRYFVINFSGNNQVINEIQVAFDLANLELEIGFIALHSSGGGSGLGWNPERLFHSLDATIPTFDVSSTDIEEVQTIRRQYLAYSNQSLNVQGLATQLGEMKAFPHRSPLRFLGYFAILESVLTHSPKPSDPYDSITRQVKKKLALLNNRWTQKIDYLPFGGANGDTVWSKMYDYRSRLAHGGSATIAGDLLILRDHETALSLLKGVVKAVIRHALAEPQLLLDLKEC